jgi:hypothetical protein
VPAARPVITSAQWEEGNTSGVEQADKTDSEPAFGTKSQLWLSWFKRTTTTGETPWRDGRNDAPPAASSSPCSCSCSFRPCSSSSFSVYTAAPDRPTTTSLGCSPTSTYHTVT